MTDKFHSLSIGNYITFDKTFRKKDYEKFFELSGDANLLHSDSDYAQNTEFGQTIVPLHLLISPFSAIVGMGLPGTSALYLDHEVKVMKPVFYNKKVTYSAKIIEKSSAQRVLRLRVLVTEENTVHIDAFINVKSRVENGVSSPSIPRKYIVKENIKKSILVTGASGELGLAIIRSISNSGHKVIAVYRDDKSIKKIKASFNGLNNDIEFIKINLGDQEEYSRLDEKLKHVTDFVHAASSPIDSDLNELISVNFNSLKYISCKLIPEFLKRQSGKIIVIGSSALHYSPQGWENYIAAKSAASTFVQGIHYKYMGYGIEGVIFSPGYIDTKFSKKFHLENIDLLEVEEVADEISTVLTYKVFEDNYIWYEKNQLLKGKYGFKEHKVTTEKNHIDSAVEDTIAPLKNINDLRQLVSDYLRIPKEELELSGVDLYPTWDSIKHIQLILYIEKKYGIVFSSNEISKTKLYKNLECLIKSKLIDS